MNFVTEFSEGGPKFVVDFVKQIRIGFPTGFCDFGVRGF